MTPEHTNTCCFLISSAKIASRHTSREITQNSHVQSLHTNRCFLALDGAAVEAQRRNTVGLSLNVENTLVVPLSRLGLGQVLGG